MTEITPELLLGAYAGGMFPMAEDRDSAELYWVDPDKRGVIPLDDFHIPRSLQKRVRQQAFDVTVDTAFDAVVVACAAEQKDRGKTWINAEIKDLYGQLHRMGFAHSLECRQDGALVGGLYGVKLGGAFFGESMFHTERDASKVALVHLVARLKVGGFSLLDTQFVTDHLVQFGAQEIPRDDYHLLLGEALAVEADFYSLSTEEPSAVLQAITQTS